MACSGCIASGEWLTQLDVPHVITLGLVGLQHRVSDWVRGGDGGARVLHLRDPLLAAGVGDLAGA